jgi:hypothetical protein
MSVLTLPMLVGFYQRFGTACRSLLEGQNSPRRILETRGSVVQRIQVVLQPVTGPQGKPASHSGCSMGKKKIGWDDPRVIPEI